MFQTRFYATVFSTHIMFLVVYDASTKYKRNFTCATLNKYRPCLKRSTYESETRLK